MLKILSTKTLCLIIIVVSFQCPNLVWQNMHNQMPSVHSFPDMLWAISTQHAPWQAECTNSVLIKGRTNYVTELNIAYLGLRSVGPKTMPKLPALIWFISSCNVTLKHKYTLFICHYTRLPFSSSYFGKNLGYSHDRNIVNSHTCLCMCVSLVINIVNSHKCLCMCVSLVIPWIVFCMNWNLLNQSTGYFFHTVAFFFCDIASSKSRASVRVQYVYLTFWDGAWEEHRYACWV